MILQGLLPDSRPGTYPGRQVTGLLLIRLRCSRVFLWAGSCFPRDKPVRIQADAVFAGIELPDGNNAVFGTSIYESASWSPDTASIDIKVDVVFGGVQVIQR